MRCWYFLPRLGMGRLGLESPQIPYLQYLTSSSGNLFMLRRFPFLVCPLLIFACFLLVSCFPFYRLRGVGACFSTVLFRHSRSD